MGQGLDNVRVQSGLLPGQQEQEAVRKKLCGRKWKAASHRGQMGWALELLSP